MHREPCQLDDASLQAGMGHGVAPQLDLVHRVGLGVGLLHSWIGMWGWAGSWGHSTIRSSMWGRTSAPDHTCRLNLPMGFGSRTGLTHHSPSPHGWKAEHRGFRQGICRVILPLLSTVADKGYPEPEVTALTAPTRSMLQRV